MAYHEPDIEITASRAEPTVRPSRRGGDGLTCRFLATVRVALAVIGVISCTSIGPPVDSSAGPSSSVRIDCWMNKDEGGKELLLELPSEMKWSSVEDWLNVPAKIRNISDRTMTVNARFHEGRGVELSWEISYDLRDSTGKSAVHPNRVLFRQSEFPVAEDYKVLNPGEAIDGSFQLGRSEFALTRGQYSLQACYLDFTPSPPAPKNTALGRGPVKSNTTVVIVE